MRTVLGFFVGILLVAGCAGSAGSPAPAASAPAPSASPSVAAASPNGGLGGVVQFDSDGAATTTTVDLAVDGATVSGAAITQFREGTHTVRLECATKSGDTWALGGKVEKTTLPGESSGTWSAVIVKEGSPQRIGIWRSDDPSTAPDCKAWLATTDFANIGDENFSAVTSGTLVPPPGL